jgi:outer membrane protein assembly factor BamB
MLRKARSQVLVLTLLAALPQLPRVSTAAEEEEDWPCWRGPRGDGISGESGFLKVWPREGLKELWRVELGTGFSSFAAVGDRLYTQSQRRGRQEVLCLDVKDGTVLWSNDLEEGYEEWQGGDGPRATPCVKDGAVYAIGTRGTLVALDAGDGSLLWEKNLLKKFKVDNLRWGVSASPLIEGDLLIVAVGAPGAPVVAFDRESGDLEWRSGSDGQGDRAGYSTPHAIDHNDERWILVFLGRSLVALEPDEGRVLWRYYWKTSWDVNAAAPIYHTGHVFISSGYDHGSVLLRAPRRRGGFPKEVWKRRVMRNKFSSSLFHEGHLYGFDESNLKCVEFKTGKEKWRQSGFGHGTLLIADGHMIILGERGDLALAEVDPERYREVARMEKVLRGRSWTVPVLHRGVLYLRNLKEAVALRMRPE